MKTIKALLLGLVAVIICACVGLTIVTRTVDPRAWYAEALMLSLNHRLISVHQMAWGHLKLRSGPYGIAALKRLKRKGASFEIRLMASAALHHYMGENDRCDDAPCGQESDFSDYKPSPDVMHYATDLPAGQTLPESFIIDTAFELDHYCASTVEKRTVDKNPDCVVRMQDFNGDGQPEVYMEYIRRSTDEGPEDQSRGLSIYHFENDEWSLLSRTNFWGFDAKTYPQRPFIVEPATMDRLLINGVSFRFQAYPRFKYRTPATDFSARYREYLPVFGASLDQVEVLFPKGAQLPADLGRAMARHQIGFERITNNPMLPVEYGSGPVVPPVEYTFAPSCAAAKDCKAVVADLDHDGRNEVILINDPWPGNKYRPFNATLFKSDGKAWTIKANVELCKEIVPDLAKAKIEVKSSSWATLRLGGNRYPVIPNPWCDNGVKLL